MLRKKQFYRSLLVCVGISISGKLIAQKDTILLAPATVIGVGPERFMSGLKLQKIDSVTLQQFRFQNIADLLAYNSAMVFKNYGPGQLTTTSFRGTSASHTAVLWNGLNINSPTLGQTDFSTVPVAGFDQLSVQYGSAASIVGTDAVGGSILLNSSNQPLGLNISLGRRQESFRNSQTQFLAKYGERLGRNWEFSGKTSAYYGGMKNKFRYQYRQGTPILPAETFQKGLVQDLFFRSNKGHQLSAHVWLTANELTLNPKEYLARELTDSKSTRTMIRYQWKDFSIRSAWVRDILDYAKGDYFNLDHAVTDRFSTRIERDFNWTIGHSGSTLSVKTGGEFTHYISKVAGYTEPKITENRGDLYVLSKWTLSRLQVSLNLRQAFVSKYRPPFTPSIGTEYVLIRNDNFNMKVRGSLAKSYRVPTLNERYWKDLGTPDIKPESGFNKELGVSQQYKFDAQNVLTTSVSAYHNRVKNWTYWNPGQSFKVENLQQVLARGLEMQGGWKGFYSSWNFGLDAGYNYTRSSQEKVYDPYAQDVVGKQLTYVPIHSGNFNAFAEYKKWRIAWQMMGVSERFTRTDNTRSLEGYVLTNVVAGGLVNLNQVQLRIQGEVNNLMNTFYLNVRSNAMPGRSFALTLLASYQSSRNK